MWRTPQRVRTQKPGPEDPVSYIQMKLRLKPVPSPKKIPAHDEHGPASLIGGPFFAKSAPIIGDASMGVNGKAVSGRKKACPA